MAKANNKNRRIGYFFKEHYVAYNKWIISYSEYWLKYCNCQLTLLFISLEKDKLISHWKAVFHILQLRDWDGFLLSFSASEYALFRVCQESTVYRQYSYWLQCITIIIKHYSIRSRIWGFCDIDTEVDTMGWPWSHQCFYQNRCRFWNHYYFPLLSWNSEANEQQFQI